MILENGVASSHVLAAHAVMEPLFANGLLVALRHHSLRSHYLD